MSTPKLPTYYISHGGGPWPWMQDWSQLMTNLAASLKAIAQELPVTPKAVLVISGHWEERDFTVMSGEHPPMVYDYSGFPAHTYQVTYPAPGSPELAKRIEGLLSEAGA